MTKFDYKQIVKELKDKKYLEDKKNAIKQAQESDILLEKCVLMRVYTSPQSTDAEKIIKNDLEIKDPLDNISGDGIKNDVKYEIKVSVHDEKCKVNIRQIRPHHNIDYYIIVSLNLFKGDNGEANVFKIPAKTIYQLVAEYGGYTHGTISKNGSVTKESLEDGSKLHEYSLTADPNASEETKSKKLWNRFLEYKVEYTKESF